MSEHINIDELEQVAAQAAGPQLGGANFTMAELKFRATFDPMTVLTLINQLRALGDRAMHLERRLSDANGEVLRLQGAQQHALRLQAGHDEAVLKIDEARQRATDAEQLATARGHTIRGLQRELSDVKVGRDALAAQIKELDARIDDLLATCHRLALELECLLLDTKDLAPVSRWWDAAMAALDGWHKAKDAASVRLAPAERPTPATRPGWRDINDIVADREKDPSKAAALERAREWLAAAQPIIPVEPVNARLVEALHSIRQYGLDTLSGRADGGDDDYAWQRAAVNEMTKRARIALARAAEAQQAEPVRLTDEELRTALQLIANKTTLNICRRIEAAVLRANGYKVEGE